MALQDLTPQLRTRLNRMERAVGWFVVVAAALLVLGFAYFLRSTAERKGWFIPKFHYQTGLNNAAGLKEGDPVRLMGFNAGEITKIIPNEPDAYYGITIEFAVKKDRYNYPGYIWDDSKVKVSSDFLGNRFLEITKGVSGVPTIAETTNRVARAMRRWQSIASARKAVENETRDANPDLDLVDPEKFAWLVKDALTQRVQANTNLFHTNLTAVYWLTALETPAVSDRLDKLVGQVENALPDILGLTNRIAAVLDHSSLLASNLNLVALSAQPAISNFTLLSAQLRGPGALGEWALGTNGQQNLQATLAGANQTIAHADTNLVALLENFSRTLDNLADITSNLNAQVQSNSNLLGAVSQAVTNTDDLVQGLKRHWLLRSAFKKKTK